MDTDLARRIRDEAYHARVLVRSLRNRTKVDAAALYDSEQRLEALITELEKSQAKEAHDDEHEDHVQDRLAAA